MMVAPTCEEMGRKTDDALGRYAGWHWPARRRFLPVPAGKSFPLCPLRGDQPPGQVSWRRKRGAVRPHEEPARKRYNRLSDVIVGQKILLRDLEEHGAPAEDVAALREAIRHFEVRLAEIAKEVLQP